MATAHTNTTATELPAASRIVANLFGENACNGDDEATTKRKRDDTDGDHEVGRCPTHNEHLSLTSLLPSPTIHSVPGLGHVVSLATYENAISRAQELIENILEKTNQSVESGECEKDNLSFSVIEDPVQQCPEDRGESPLPLQLEENVSELPAREEPTKKKKRRKLPLKRAEHNNNTPPQDGVRKRRKSRGLSNQWERKYEELRAFKAQHNHCDVNGSHQNPKLLRWVFYQRAQHKCLREGKTSHMTPEKIQKLRQLGFKFSIGTDRVEWNERLEQLKAYRETFGSCNVPQKDRKGVPAGLGNWVLEQRRQYKLHTNKDSPAPDSKPKGVDCFNQERIEALEAIGFEWRMRKYKS